MTLLGIPGDNTYSNYQEAQRAFWRSTVLPLVVRTAKALSSWLAPAWEVLPKAGNGSGSGKPSVYPERGRTRLELRPDLDQIEALSSEREALWARIEKVSFLTLNEKRQAVGYAPLEEAEPPVETDQTGAPVVGKYRPDQPRAPRGVPEGGQWVDEGGGSGGGGGGSRTSDGDRSSGELRRKRPVQLAQAEGETRTDADEGVFSDESDEPVQLAQARRLAGPVRTITVRGRNYTVHEALAGEVEGALTRLNAALKRVQELDPDWKPLPSARSTEPPADLQVVIRGLRMEAQEAEARITVIERGGVPLGFNTREEFRDFGRTVWSGLNEAGHRDAVPYMRGSSVTGHNFSTGEIFDLNRTSDYDIAIVSRDLFKAAQRMGIRMKDNGTRTVNLKPNHQATNRLGLARMLKELETATGRKVSIVIHPSVRVLQRRGPFVPID